VIVAGVDIGSSSAKAVILEDGRIASTSVIPTGPDSAETARRVMDRALSANGISMNDVGRVVATGYGRINVPFASKCVTEISCHARGIVAIFANVRTILDMGGQDCKAIRCNERGKVLGFLMNDKCAAGTGRYLERVAATLGVPIEDLGPRSLRPVEGPATISSFCAVFAEGDALSLVREGKHVNDIIAGVCEALTTRVERLIRQMGLAGDFSITGGIARNIGIVTRLERDLDVKPLIAPDPQVVGALGAALFAEELAERS
jgi:predicted CoA-substrate-specific enzyme activase